MVIEVVCTNKQLNGGAKPEAEVLVQFTPPNESGIPGGHQVYMSLEAADEIKLKKRYRVTFTEI